MRGVGLLKDCRMMENEKFKAIKDLEYSSVQKAIRILLAFIPDNQPMGNLQLSNLLGLNKSTVSRLIQVLLHYGLIQQDEETKKFELGRTSALLGNSVKTSQADRLVQFSRPYLEDLRDTVGESVCLEVIESGCGKVVAEAVGPPPLSVSFPDSNPVHVSAGAKVILAYSEEDLVDQVIPGDLEKITENSITDPGVFKDQLEEIRQHGIAYDHGEANLEVHAVAAAVFNHREKPVAAICICVPKNRINKILNNHAVEALKKTASLISKRMFFAQN